MKLEFNPDATIAIAVGIERYDVGPRWSLSGPALDSARFVEWLRARNVPAKNIYLLQAPLDANVAAVNQILAPLGVATRTATTTEIRAIVQREIAARAASAQLLYVFWGGHGAMESDDARRLFCQDAQQADLNPVNLTSLLEVLRSRPWSTMRNQIVITDVCANYYEEMRYRESQADVRFTVGGRDPTGVDQLVLLAAASGQAAANDPVRRTGAFSEAVQRIINDTPEKEWPDFEKIALDLERKFQELTATAEAQQRPVAMRWRRSNGSRGGAGEYPVSEAVQRVAIEGKLAVRQLRAFVLQALDQTSLKELANRQALVAVLPPEIRDRVGPLSSDAEQDLLNLFALALSDESRAAEILRAIDAVESTNPATRDLLRSGIEQVRVAIAVRGLVGGARLTSTSRTRALFRRSLPDVQLAPTADTLDEMIAALQDASPRERGALPPVVEFVERVAREVGNDALSDWVTRWSLDEKGWIQPALDLRGRLAREANASPRVWRVVVDASEAHVPTTARGRHLQYWVYDPAGTSVESDVVSCVIAAGDTAESAARRAMESVHQAASARVESAGTPAPLAFELLVTLEQLIWDFDEWKLRNDDVDSLTFGVTSPLTLRWIERARGQGSQGDADRRNTWRLVTQRVRDRIGNENLATHWVSRDGKTPAALQASLRNSDYGTVVGLEFVPAFDQGADRERRLVRAVLYGGAPFVVWRRHAPTEWLPVRNSLDTFLNDPNFTDLPRRFVDLRVEALDDETVAARSAAILWDDPDQNPLDALLSHTSPRTP